MEKRNIMIRLEKKEEYQKVENLVRESFWNVYRPGCLEKKTEEFDKLFPYKEKKKLPGQLF